MHWAASSHMLFTWIPRNSILMVLVLQTQQEKVLNLDELYLYYKYLATSQ
uniref:Uncharacterized protein n=1 Tax=Rhizophora mucronata TaxID=61149 RepID=A0A2P2Q031_RHIMU